MEAEAILWAAILVIFSMVMIARVSQLRQTSLDDYPADANGNPIVPASHKPELKRQIDELRARVEVLERIVVDERDSMRLSAEIERLRDTDK